LVDEDETNVEFSIMVMGGAASVANSDGPTAPVAQGLSGSKLLDTEEFWVDLKGFLIQRLRDEGEGEKALEIFRGAWNGSSRK